MAFIREYADASGDPFTFRRPKWVKRFKPGRSLGRVARGVMHAVPFVGGAMDFARGYGLEQGDPAGSKRKSAGAGPKHKAARKAEHRAAMHAPKLKGHQKRRGKGGFHLDLHQVARTAAGYLPVAGGLAQSALDAAHQHDVESAAASGGDLFGGATLGAMPAHVRHDMGMGGHRKKRNFANVRALRHALGRVEGFERIVKSIEKAYPRLKRGATHHAAKHRGHKAGCKCVACR
jgi:hypothetical protein